MPPAAWISSSARSKPCFHCAPYCAFGPVRGPLTPRVIGSEDCANALRDIAVPARAEIGADAFVEQALNIVAALGMDGRETRVYGCTIDASVIARCRCGRELALGPRQTVSGIVEDVLVGLGPGFENLGVAHQQAKV